MPLTVLRRDGHDDLLESLESASRELICRAGEEWTLALDVEPRGLSLVATGPARPSCPGWEDETAVAGDEPRRYRRALGSEPQWSKDALLPIVRALVWNPLEFAPNPIHGMDGVLACALERVVLDVLRDRPAEPLTVRFGVWDGEGDGPRYVCKVEAVPATEADQPPAWRWWSPLVRSAAELSSNFQEAVRRRDRAAAAAADERQYWGWGGARQAGA